ncbi:MAG TPA: response regulator [Limnobacter sp.]|nr:response regulator [Limnobacter sp.]
MKILLVDDDQQVRWLLDCMLHDLGHDVLSVASGEEALTVLLAGQFLPDCMILDRQMPFMSGIELMRALRQSQTFSDIPIIMLTAATTAEEMAEGLTSGAQMYLPKPASKSLLRASIASLKSVVAQRQGLMDEMSQTRQGLRLAQSMTFGYRTPAQANQIACTLAQLSPKPANVVIGLSELLINAVEHGNLGLGYAEKSRLLQAGDLEQEIAMRLMNKEFRARVARVFVEQNEESARVTICDEGNGFDWSQYLDFSPQRAFDLHGRGIAIAKNSAFESMRYLGRGNVVELFLSVGGDESCRQENDNSRTRILERDCE